MARKLSTSRKSLTIKAMGTDAMVVRHTATGAPWRIAEWIEQPVLNGGDGAHQHPTQALLDALTIRQHFGTLEGLKIGIVGDIKHSRVARSDIQAFSTLGADVTMVAPRTLLPVVPEVFDARASEDLDDVISELDVVYVLRVQAERGGASVFPSLPEYTARYGITKERFARLKPEAIVLHPGPMNRGVEIEGTVADEQRHHEGPSGRPDAVQRFGEVGGVLGQVVAVQPQALRFAHHDAEQVPPAQVQQARGLGAGEGDGVGADRRPRTIHQPVNPRGTNANPAPSMPIAV